ncbi:MAG TPA: hypothetical protein VGN08_10095 [Solirubrobacteraceae bacterium]|jgi:hypothetical protein
MSRLPSLDVTLLPGARGLLELHARELPQRDDLCGAFCASLALRAAGIEEHDGEPVDQDTVALAAGSVVSRHPDPDILPRGEPGRRDYRATLPLVEDPHLSGTTALGLLEAVQTVSGGQLTAIPYTGPWTPETLGGLFDSAAALDRPAALLANIATRHLWGSRATPGELLDYLYDGADAGPPPDWDVGHFVCLTARVRGPAGSLYALADTYPSLGSHGVHMQPQERLAAALERPDLPAGGMLAIVSPGDAAAVRRAAETLALREGMWDNGTVAREMLR